MNEQLVSYSEIAIAHDRWKLNWPLPTEKLPSRPSLWMTFLGVKLPNQFLRSEMKDKPYMDGNYWVPDKGANRIRGLNGPHWQTLLKVWAIQEASDGNAQNKSIPPTTGI